MSNTRMAIAAVFYLSTVPGHSPAWELVDAVVSIACAVYLLWFLWFGPDVLELPKRRHVTTDPACLAHRRPASRLARWWFDRNRGRRCSWCAQVARVGT